MMKIVNKYLALIVLATNLLFSQDSKLNNYHFAYSENVFQIVDISDAKAISSVLSEHLIKSYDNKAVGKSTVDNIMGNLDQILNDGVDIIALLGSEFLSLRGEKRLIPYYSLEVNNHVGFEYAVIVSKSSNINNITDLKGKKVGISANNKISPTYIWFESLFNFNSSQKKDNYFSELELNYNSKQLLLSTFFGNLDACVVNIERFEIMNELNPQIKSKLKVMLVSPRLLTGLICFNKSIVGTPKEKILRTMLEEIHQNKYGKQLLNLFSIDKLIPFKEEHLNSLEIIMNKTKIENEK